MSYEFSEVFSFSVEINNAHILKRMFDFLISYSGSFRFRDEFHSDFDEYDFFIHKSWTISKIQFVS
jgi:hypothetical protein